MSGIKDMDSLDILEKEINGSREQILTNRND
jgi:hypothetical protein